MTGVSEAQARAMSQIRSFGSRGMTEQSCKTFGIRTATLDALLEAGLIVMLVRGTFIDGLGNTCDRVVAVAHDRADGGA